MYLFFRLPMNPGTPDAHDHFLLIRAEDHERDLPMTPAITHCPHRPELFPTKLIHRDVLTKAELLMEPGPFAVLLDTGFDVMPILDWGLRVARHMEAVTHGE